ncbi:MAG: hypothetical protein WEA54_03725 [Actinomycetota bacterium]
MRPKSRFLLVVTSALIAVGVVTAPAPAGASPATVGTPAAAEASAAEGSTPDLLSDAVRDGLLSQDEVDRYLASALSGDAIPPRFRSEVPWDGTMILLALQRRAEAGDLPADVSRTLGFAGTSTTERAAGDSSKCGGTGPFPKIAKTKFFKIHFDPTKIRSPLNIGDYKASLNRVYRFEVKRFGWWKPPQRNNAGPKYHAYIANLGSGLYGFATTGGTYGGPVGNNPHTPWPDGDAFASCLVLNSDYRGFPSRPRGALDATSAHEYNHSLQFGIGGLTGSNSPTIGWTEGGATYMEDEVWDTANDSWYYLWPLFNRSMSRYGDAPAEFPYSYWVVFRAIVEQYGTGTAGGGQLVMRTFWELVSKETASNLGAWEQALFDAHGGDLGEDYHEASIALKFLKKCRGGYVYPYCLQEANGYQKTTGPNPNTTVIGSVGDDYDGTVQDNYALNWVGLPGSGTYDVDVTNTSGEGTFAVSIVCDTGTELDLVDTDDVTDGGPLTTSVDADGCVTRPVAVVSNVTRTGGNNPMPSNMTYSVETSPA